MKEYDIRPAEIFDQYLKLSANDAQHCFKGVERQAVDCPGCGLHTYTKAFKKLGFDYATCDNCGTLYQTPRPPLESFEAFYHDSESSKYWAETFFPAVAETRREKIFIPRVERLIKFCNENKFLPETLIDIGAGYGILLEEWKKRYPLKRAIAIEPSQHLASICRKKGHEVIENIVEKINQRDLQADLIVCFEVLEHVFDTKAFIRAIANLLKPGGHLMFSTLCVDGFDIQTLWQHSNSISPHHINFLSRKGFKELFRHAGLKVVELITPGVLDVDIVKNADRNDPSLLNKNRFAKQIIGDKGLAAAFQDFLISEKLSSHLWIFGKK